MKKILLIASLVAVFGIALTGGLKMIYAETATLDPFPSGNDLNKEKGQPYVEPVSNTTDSVTLRLVNPKAYQVWFEYQKDNSSATGILNSNPCKPSTDPLPNSCGGKRYLRDNDEKFPTFSLAGGESREETITGLSEKVSIRMTFGPERNWDFDWVTFNVYNPDPEGKHQMSISGSVYRDHKLNDCFGMTSCNDKAENLKDGWEINLYKEVEGNWTFVESAQTNTEGVFAFSPVKDAGTYHVCEVVKDGWTQQVQDWSGTPYHIATQKLSGNSQEGPYCRTINYADTGNHSNKFHFGNVDTKKPFTEVLSPDSGNSYKTSDLPVVNIKSTDGESGISLVVANMHGPNGFIKSCVNQTVSPAQNEKDFTCDLSSTASSFVDGEYYIKTNAKDLTGQISNTVSWYFTIDNTAPVAPSNLSWTTAKGNVIANGGTTKEVSGTASWDASASSDVDHYIYKYWNAIDGNQYKVGSEYDPNVNGVSLPGTFDQGEGTHYYCVVAVDAAGNESECSDPFKITYTIDRTAPAAPTILAPVARQWLKSSPILNTWSEVTKDINGDDEEIDHYQIAYNYDDGHTFGGVNTCDGLVMIGVDGFIGCRDVTETTRQHQPADDEQGGVTIWVRAIDVDGNAGAWSKSVHYYFDKTAPATDINVSSVVDGKFTVSGTATDNLALNRVYVQLVSRTTNDRCGGTTVNLITSPFSTSSPWSVDYDISTLKVTGTSTACVDGNFAAHVLVTDMAGNSSTAGWTENFMVTTPENNGGGDIENPAPTVLGNYFVAKAEELNVGFSVKNLTNNASSVKVSLYDADNNLITENIGNTQVMVDLLNTNSTEISSPFWIPTKANDEYWNFGTPDWKNANKPSHAIVTLTYNTDEEVASDKIPFISRDELGNNWEALIASLPEDQNGIPTTPGPTGRAGGGLAFTTAYTTPSTTLLQQEGRVLGATTYQFTQDLKFGSVHDEVKSLQKFLNLKGFTVATSGAGSLGNETRVFGPKTKAALIKYQEANPVILTNVGIMNGKGTGNFYWSTKQSANEMLLENSEISALLAE